MKKVVLKLDLYDDQKEKKKAMKAVSTISGIESIAIDMKGKKLTVIGDVDPIVVVSKLRKLRQNTELLTVGPAKEPEKKKEEDKKKVPNEQIAEYLKAYNTYMTRYYDPYMAQQQHSVHSAEENPNACVIS